MERTFTIDEARALMPEVLLRAERLVPIRADLSERAHAMATGAQTGIPEVKALEAQMSELLDWFTAQGIQVKGYAPLLLDFPMRDGDRTLLLCWLEGESSLDWYHDATLGFMGRRRIDDLLGETGGAGLS